MSRLEREVLVKPKPPGPAPTWRNKLSFWRDPLGFTNEVLHYGEIVRWLDFPNYFLNSPVDIEPVLGKYQLRFDRNFRSASWRRLLGNGLLSSSGEFWLRQRRLTQPAFHHERVANYGEIMTELTTQLLARWQVGQVYNIHDAMMQLTLDVVARVFFSYEDTDSTVQVGAAFDQLVKLADFQKNPWQLILDMVVNRLSQNATLSRCFPALKKRQALSEAAMSQLNQVVYKVIERRRQLGESEQAHQTDLLAMLMQARDEEGKGMTDQQLRDEVLTMFIAGHETTAVTLSWALYLLDQHKAIQEKMLSELEEVVGARLPTVADLPRLSYLEKITRETLRLYPPLWLTPRRLLDEEAEYEAQGYHFSSEDVLYINIYGLHHDPRYYPAPFEFKPERWSEEMLQELPKFAYLPFGAGPRQCIGKAFGMQEVMLVLATILQHYKLELAPGQKVKAVPSLTLRPRGLKMLVRIRT